MHLELVDALRCLRPHEPTTLVASVERIADRDVVTGTLGCPVCDARYPVIDGAVVFDAVCQARSRIAPAGLSSDMGETATRVAALLDLTDAGGIVLLQGAWADAAEALSRIVPIGMVLLNPPGRPRGGEARSPVYAPVAPVAQGSIRAAAAEGHADAALVDSLVRALRPGGRLLGSADLGVPAGVRELARDADGWVGERLAVEGPARDGPPIALRRR
jgi:hypothetical protein